MATATRVTAREARQALEAGGEILVSERGHEETTPVGRLTTTHTRESITWDQLASMVETWRNRYPNQRYYVVTR